MPSTHSRVALTRPSSDAYDAVVPVVPLLTHDSPYSRPLTVASVILLCALLPLLPLVPLRPLALAAGLLPIALAQTRTPFAPR